MTSPPTTALPDTVHHLLAQGEPWVSMGESALTEFIVEFAPAAVTRGHIARYVRTTTDLAQAGDRMTPAILQRMLRRIRDNGHAVVIPVCERCGRERIIGRGPDDRRICKPCTDALRAEYCADCGRLRPVCIRRDRKPLCNNCRRRLPDAKKPCIRCGNARLVHTATADGPLCPECAPGKIEPCVHCGRTTRVRVRFTGGATCSPCFDIIRGTRRPCPRCQRVTLVASVADDGTLTCTPCAGRLSPFICASCGIEDIRDGKRCYPCSARDAVDALFRGGIPERREALEPLRVRLTNHPEPKSMVQWPKRSASAGVIRDMLTGRLDVAHEALDEHPITQAAELMRHALTDVGVLPPRDQAWAHFERWLDRFLTGHPTAIARVLGPYCRWSVVARTRLLIARNGISDGTFDRARSSCRIALVFLTHLEDHNLDLHTGSQTIVEDYLEQFPRHLDQLRTFIRWAADTGRATRMSPPPSRWIDPSTSYPIPVYRDWMHRFETDETIPLRTRICGLLCGTLGRPSSAVAKLTRSDITDTGDEMTVTSGTSPVRLRDPLPALIRRQLDAPRRWDTDSDWLFPSKLRAGAHTDYSMMVKDLQTLGCSIVSLRGAALLALAAIMPAGPLSDLTGISVGVANRWQTLAAAAYSGYPALRLE